ncbi:MAG TPA: NADH-quinone oxidoreductase subunit L [Anaerolineae bacterium]|nr:NADH-quinone oxidoreductase subunit L [Anaerolineae bacterium]
MDKETLELMTWLIPVGPLLSFFLITLFAKHNKTLSAAIAWAAVFTSLGLGWLVSFNVIGLQVEDMQNGTHELRKNPVVIADSEAWLPFQPEIENWLNMGVAVDPLTAVMLFMVPFAVTMIFIYSVGYHNYGKPNGTHLGTPNHGKQEPLFSRFFAFMSLFAAGMLTLVVADNLLLAFMGWEIMGLCSYLLIGFWYAREYDPDPKNAQKLPPRRASIKAFMTTRAGDVFMLLGIVGFYKLFGTLTFADALSAGSLIAAAGTEYSMYGMTFDGATWMGVLGILIFIGTVGKSAQWPLHVWLPNAMEGPTPVSAVIHAAAMVSAGVYVVIRIFPLLAVGMEASGNVSLIIGGIGAFTALMAATIAVAQDDVKGVLAYSTISQLGFMIAALGIGAYIAAAFHLITHAFFKALLFLGSGSIIHGMEHGAEHVHDHHTDPQDMMNMGGLKDKMPVTFWTFVVGGFALSGFPFVTAGFWSKDEILADAYYQISHGHGVIPLLSTAIFWMLAAAALLTAFYTMRQIALTFFGEPRTPLAEHAHESNGYMIWPLRGLAFFAITAGFVGIPETFPVLGQIFNYNFFHHFVGETIYETMKVLYAEGLVAHDIITLPFQPFPVSISIGVALGGLGLGWLVYGVRPLKEGQADPLVRVLGPIHTFLRNKWYWDEIYSFFIIKPVVWFSEYFVYEVVDRGVIDTILHVVAKVFYAIGQFLKRTEEIVFGDAVDWVKDMFLVMAKEVRILQSGRIQEYAGLTLAFTFLLTLLILYVLPILMQYLQ